MNVEAQRVELELRDELADSISKAVSDANRARIAELEKAEAELRIEVSKYVWQCAGLRLWDYALILKYTLFLLKLHLESWNDYADLI